MEKEKCEICDKIIDGDSVLISQDRFEEIGYKIPVSHIKGETETEDISKVKGKPFVRVGGFPCHCGKRVSIAIKRIKQ